MTKYGGISRWIEAEIPLLFNSLKQLLTGHIETHITETSIDDTSWYVTKKKNDIVLRVEKITLWGL